MTPLTIDTTYVQLSRGPSHKNLKEGFSLLIRWIYTFRSLLIEMETKEIKLYSENLI